MADNYTELLGIWKLGACDMEYQDSGAREPYFSAAPPSGYLILTSEGGMMGLVVGGDREPGQTDTQQAALFRTMVAYTGWYRCEGDQFITKDAKPSTPAPAPPVHRTIRRFSINITAVTLMLRQNVAERAKRSQGSLEFRL